MAQYNHLPIFQAVYDLNLEIYSASSKFSREYKYSLGQKLKEIIAELLDLIIIANSEKDKLPALKQARIRMERLKIHLRLSNDLKILGLKRYEKISRDLMEISKQLSKWTEWAGKNSLKTKSEI